MGKRITKAVVAAAGFGTRLLPQTKAMPKEMLPLVDKPIIQYVVEELAAAGIEDIIIVTGYHKRAIDDHFDQVNADLMTNLEQGGKDRLITEISRLPVIANFAFVRQHKGPYGSARPIMNVAHLIGDEPFIYTFADDLIVSKPNRFKQMVDAYDKNRGIILPSIEINQPEDYDRYGVLAGKKIADNIIKVDKLIEKPGRVNAPSNLASVGGYVLTPDVFSYLDKGLEKLDDNQEFYLTSFILEPMIADGYPVYGLRLKDAKYYDTGSKLGYLKTVVDFALLHEELSDEFRDYLRGLDI